MAPWDNACFSHNAIIYISIEIIVDDREFTAKLSGLFTPAEASGAGGESSRTCRIYREAC
jgi:hypothetical protein